MDFNFDGSDLVVLGTVIALLVVKKAFRDLVGERVVFTPLRVVMGAFAILAAWGVWTLVAVGTGDEPITRVMAQTFLVTMGCIVMVAAASFFLIIRLEKRVTAIEAHCGPSRARTP
jgi:hypothetical protein